jgi:hypothetical protein
MFRSLMCFRPSEGGEGGGGEDVGTFFVVGCGATAATPASTTSGAAGSTEGAGGAGAVAAIESVGGGGLGSAVMVDVPCAAGAEPLIFHTATPPTPTRNAAGITKASGDVFFPGGCTPGTEVSRLAPRSVDLPAGVAGGAGGWASESAL